MRDTPLITVYSLRMHTHTNAYRYLFISKRQPNYHDYRAPLRNETTSRTLYLRTRNVISSSWTERMCARATSPTLCQYGDRFEDFACIMPLSRPQRIVTMFIGCGLRERDVGTANQPVSSHPVHPKGNILSLSPSLRRDALPIYTSVFPFRKIVVIRRRFIPTAIREFPPRLAGCRLLTRECACDYFRTEVREITVLFPHCFLISKYLYIVINISKQRQ